MLSFAHDFEVGGIYYSITSSTAPYTVEVTYVNYNYDTVTIPSSVHYDGKTYIVTCIGQYAFTYRSGLTHIDIPNRVTRIGDGAFSGCSGLTSVTIPNSVTTIGICAFSGCSGLNALTIPSSISDIGQSAFSGCSGLSSIKVDESNPKYDSRNNCNAIIEKVSNSLITGCKNTTIPNNVTSIGDGAFSGCTGLTSIFIPNSVTSIGYYVFEGCSGLTSLTVESGNKKYDSRENCNAIIETESNTLVRGCRNTIIPDNIKIIDNYAFDGCYDLNFVTIPNGVTSIGGYAFNGCTGLTSINIPNSVTVIGGEAFSGCTGLASVTIPNSVIYLVGTFRGCSGLTSVNIPNSVTVIDLKTFEDCSSLTSITSPSSVTIIGDFAFSGCSSLTSITIPNSVTSIGYFAFKHCSSLTSITIPKSVTSIGWGAFSGCSGLTSVSIPNSVTSIGDSAFGWCTGLKEITSYIQEPFQTGDYCWNGVNKSIPLYVPAGTKEKYQSTGGWKDFTNIIEFGGERIEPLTEPQEVDVAVVPDQISLNGMVVGNTYYALDADNGDGTDSENGCVVINTTTTEEAIDGIAGKDISDASVKAVFKGIIFMVPAGTGTVSINAETLGTSSLMVKIGSLPAQAFQLAERETVEIPYTVAEPTYVYIYAGTGTQAARSVGAARAAAAENSVKVYSYKWEPADPTGINSVDNSQSATGNEAGDWYTIDGRKLSSKPAQKGIYIVNGRKVAVK